MEAVLYTRISNDRAGDAAGVGRQEAACRDLAKAKGWTVAEVFTDNDVSAYRGIRRPAYERMLDGLRTGRFGAIVAWDSDRLHRSPLELESFIALVEANRVKVATVTAGQIDLTTPSGRMIARSIGNFARYESEHKSERQRSKAAELARQGKPAGGGTRPFGFKDDRVSHVPSEAREIRKAAKALLAGASVYSVLTDWQKRGVTTTTGKDWKSFNFRRMITSGRIAGIRDHRGETQYQAAWKPIISVQDHHALVGLFTDPSRKPSARSAPYLLTRGIAVCGLCGAKLVARPKGDKRRAYVCSTGPDFNGCGKIGALAESLEGYVRDRICEVIAGPELAEALARAAAANPKQVATASEIQQMETALEQLARDHYSDNLLTRAEFFAARDSIKAKLDAARASIASDTTTPLLTSLPTDFDALVELWDSQPMEWRRQRTRVLIDRVIVGPAVSGRNFFDPDRVTITWRA